jgi:hypothetical protein
LHSAHIHTRKGGEEENRYRVVISGTKTLIHK